jgi:hypothetical protein
MTVRVAELDVAGWCPQLFGRGHVRNVKDPIIEPLWDGERVLLIAGASRAAGTAGAAGAGVGPGSWTDPTITDEAGEELEGPALVAISGELRDAIRAETLVLDGYLTRQPNTPAPQSPGLGLEMPTVQQMAGQLLFGRRSARAAKLTPVTHATVDRTVPVAFVAVDLLVIDDESLLDIPLLERKRILETAFAETQLLRRSPFVRPPVDSWLIAWRALGFRELAYKSANSRYTPGRRNDGWARIAIPRD